MKRIFQLMGLAIGIAVLVMLFNAFTVTDHQLSVDVAEWPDFDHDAAAQRLAEAIRIPTVSYEDTTLRDDGAFEAFIRFVEEAFPRVHRSLDLERVNRYSLLYTWTGRRADAEPWLLMGHHDVVPADESTLAEWTYGPFDGVIADGYIWGRGTLDNKNTVMGILEAVELLQAEGFEPERTLYLAFGHDEEIGGDRGAVAMATLLGGRGVRLAMVLDEGGVLISGAVPGIDRPVAMIGTSEKGYIDLELVAVDEGGHSSMPPSMTASGRIARAVDRLQQNPMPASLQAASPMFDYLLPEMDFAQRLALSNTWLLGPVIRRQLEASPSTNAILRTTTAPTMLHGSPKPNVLPTRATAVVNFRVLPGDDRESVLRHVRRVIDDPAVEIREMGFYSPPSPVSDTNTPEFRRIHETIRSLYPEALVAPYLVLGATDARHYSGLSDQVFRFMPVRLANEDLSRLHGIDERIEVAEYARSVAFYRQLILNMDSF